MLWDVLHEWPSGAQFKLKCYCHWATLVVRDTRDGSGHFLHRKEGVTQGYPLTMIAYDIGVIPLIRELQGSHPLVTKPWYTDDTKEGGKFGHILEHLWDLQARGPARGYYLEPTKKLCGRGPRECIPSRRVLSGGGHPSGDGTPLPRGVHRRQGGGGEVVGIQNNVVGGFRGDPRQGFPQAPSACI